MNLSKAALILSVAVTSLLAVACTTSPDPDEGEPVGDEASSSDDTVGDEPIATAASALTCATSCRRHTLCKAGATYKCSTTCGYSYITGCQFGKGASYCSSTC